MTMSTAHEDEFPRRVVVASMAGVMATMLMAALDGTIVGTAMPTVIAELNGFSQYASVTTVYLVTSTLVVPIVGKLSDLYGRKPFLLAGVIIFTLGSMLCGAAQTMAQLVVFRGLQGIGAGIAQGMAFVTIADLFPPSRRGPITGMMGAVFGVASVIGPALGGLLTDGPGWRWCFYVNVPVGIAAVLLLVFAFPHLKTARATPPRVDWLGAATLVLGVGPLLLALSWGGQQYRWDSPQVLALSAFGLLMSAAFVAVERRAAEPVIPPSLFRNRVVWTSMAASGLVAFGMFGTTLFIPLFVQTIIGSSATQSGAIMTPMMISLIASSIIGGQAVTRLGRYKAVAVIGVVLTTAGIYLLSLMNVSSSYPTVVTNMIVVGMGLGLTMPVFTLAVQNAVDPGQVGAVTASVQFVRSMGGSLGAALLGAILVNRYGPALTAAIPADVAARTPQAILATLQNPQMLMNPASASVLAGAGGAQVAPLMEAVRGALASSLHDVFLIAAVLVAAGIVVTLMLVDLPLRTTNRRAAVLESV